MDSRYIKRLFGNNYHGFNYKEAEKNLDVSFDVFNSRIRKIGGEVKISADVKLEPIYWFTLFCYYNWFGYNIKVVKAPEFCNFLRVYYAFTETEEITIKGKPADIYGNEKKLGKKKVAFAVEQIAILSNLIISKRSMLSIYSENC